MDGFERRREQKKMSILEAALSLFMDFGTQKVSVAEIAKKANVSQVTIYNYFESKDSLVKEVFKYYVDQIWEEQRKILDSDLPFHEKIKKTAFTKSEATQEMTNKFYEDFMRDYSAGQSYVEKLYVNEALPKLMTLFNEGRDNGYIDKNISNEAILLYLQMFKEYMQREDVSKKIFPLTNELTHLFFYGIAGKK
ncbi:TetR/AcrR family transcriptional regulator [Salirhabdus sp. Marseille-P4669]|uniref:TetR/AcrR family transcriptional regulator n=1 Tax=Salirhabdus sp. Marseille-P4669 TaxID=2042310 RepID=UPI000C79C7E0|nr:TetR/AcrR family transcriptional regulator [Salirhabdus sp. Marseille-P4669]